MPLKEEIEIPAYPHSPPLIQRLFTSLKTLGLPVDVGGPVEICDLWPHGTSKYALSQTPFSVSSAYV